MSVMVMMLAAFVDVNGLHLYYEVHGKPTANPPLVLLHGGGSSIETSFAPVIEQFAKHRQVIAFDQQGHGRTADIPDRPFSFEQSADDAAALLAHLGIKQGDFLGYSNGGTIAMQIAIRHPKLVHKLVIMSANYRRDGMQPGFWDGMQHASLKDMPAELKETYLRLAPHPEHLQSFHDKSVKRMLEFKDIPDEALKAIQAPALIMIGDHDVIRPEHAIAMYRLFPHAQLAIMPGADHMTMVAWSAPQVAIVEAFYGQSEFEQPGPSSMSGIGKG
jgi:pimeloyl-ACP methyl ester carboxylesterase